MYLFLLYGAALFFFLSLWDGFRFLQRLFGGKGGAGTAASALMKLKRHLFLMSLFQGAMLPLVYAFGEVEDAPAIIFFSLLVLGGTLVFLAVTVLLEEILKKG